MSNIDQLKTWRNSAYAMEQSLVQVLENHAEDFPNMRQKIEAHLKETNHDAERVKYRIDLLDETPLTTKSLPARAPVVWTGQLTTRA